MLQASHRCGNSRAIWDHTVLPRNWVSSVTLYTEDVTALACYIFDTYQPILVILAGNSYEVSAIISYHKITRIG